MTTTTQLCGTRRGYARHQQYGEPRCQPCRAANAAYHREYARTRKAARRAKAAEITRSVSAPPTAPQPEARPRYLPLPGGVVPAAAIAAAVAAAGPEES